VGLQNESGSCRRIIIIFWGSGAHPLNSENGRKHQETSGKSGLTLLRATLVGGDGLCNFNHGMLWSMLLRTDGNGALSRPPQREEEKERTKERRLN